MKKESFIPTEREWLIMEAVWEAKDRAEGITSAEIMEKIGKEANMSVRTERVLLHHLCKKGLLRYTVDEHDSRVYHYYPERTREECLQEKSNNFIKTYFRGSGSGAIAAFLQGTTLTDEQVNELESILKKQRQKQE